MPFRRFQIDLAVREPLPAVLERAMPAIRRAIRELKSYAEKINEGQVNEELTTRAVWHRCRHDIAQPCEPEQQI